jgi:hypothetical protein
MKNFAAGYELTLDYLDKDCVKLLTKGRNTMEMQPLEEVNVEKSR